MMRTLLIDDEAHRAQSIAYILPKGMEVIWCNNGPLAEKMLRQEQFGMLLLDHDLYCASGMNGQSVARIVAETQWHGAKVFIHSQNASGASTMREILKDFDVTVCPWDNGKKTAEGLEPWLKEHYVCSAP